MKPETFWPREKLYLYAMCALFSNKLPKAPLNSQQLRDYIPYYLNVDEQIEQLEQLQKDGLLDFTISRIDDSSAKYSIFEIHSEKFLSILKEYIEQYRNDELIGDIRHTFTDNNDRLIKYINSSTRKDPVINPINIWDDWNSFNSQRFPFWEVVLAFQLTEAKGEITTLGYSISNSNSYKEEARPFVNVKVFNKELQQNTDKSQQLIKHKVGIIVTSRGKLQLIADGKRFTIRTYKSEKNNTYRAAQALYGANEDYLDRNSLNIKAGSKTLLKGLIKNMGITGILDELFIEYGDKSTVSLKRHAIVNEEQFERLLLYVKVLNRKNK